MVGWVCAFGHVVTESSGETSTGGCNERFIRCPSARTKASGPYARCQNAPSSNNHPILFNKADAVSKLLSGGVDVSSFVRSADYVAECGVEELYITTSTRLGLEINLHF